MIQKLLLPLAVLLTGCATLTPTQGALLVDASTLAQVVLPAAAAAYGGPAAGQAASAGLSALGSVMQGYVNSKIPTAVVVASPGIGTLGDVAAQYISSNAKVTQANVNTVNAAAAIAATH